MSLLSIDFWLWHLKIDIADNVVNKQGRFWLIFAN